MSKADEALADVRGWLCDNLSDGNAGMICGMLSVVSRHINELEAENDKLRELCIDMASHLREAERIHGDELLPDGYITSMHELGIEVPE